MTIELRESGELIKVIRRIATAMFVSDNLHHHFEPIDGVLKNTGHWDKAIIAYKEILKIDGERAA